MDLYNGPSRVCCLLGSSYAELRNIKMVNLASLLRTDVDLYAICVLPEPQGTAFRNRGVPTAVRIPSSPGTAETATLSTPLAQCSSGRCSAPHRLSPVHGLLESAYLPTRCAASRVYNGRTARSSWNTSSLLRHRLISARKIAVEAFGWKPHVCGLRLDSLVVCADSPSGVSVKPFCRRHASDTSCIFSRLTAVCWSATGMLGVGTEASVRAQGMP